MTRKDYVAIAEILRVCHQENSYNWKNIVEGIATVLKNDNPLFDRKRFYAACGV